MKSVLHWAGTCLLTLLPLLPAYGQRPQHENGWYHLNTGRADSIGEGPIVTVKDFTVLKLEADAYGKYALSGQVSKFKRERWASETEKAIGKRIAFVLNDSVISSPQVNMRIPEGRFLISNRSGLGMEELFQRIRREKRDSIEALFRGWDKNSTWLVMSETQRDSTAMSMDYWEAKAWTDLSAHPEEHYWYSLTDTAEYKRLEHALLEELQRPHASSQSDYYTRLKPYRRYKDYIARHPEYINLLFQSFLMEQPNGLHGYLVDDLIQNVYPQAPSLRTFTGPTDNADDERMAIYRWQRQIWRLMNEKKTPAVQ